MSKTNCKQKVHLVCGIVHLAFDIVQNTLLWLQQN